MRGARSGRDGGREHGAVLAMMCVIVVTCMGAAMFAIDAGLLWASQRRLRTATDAAALAAAGEYANGGDGCNAVDDSYTGANDPAARVLSCSSVPMGGNGYHLSPGYVTVKAKRPVDFQFASVMGIGDTDVKSTTTVRYGSPESATGLRPMGLCLYANPALTSWMNLAGGGPTGDSGAIRIIYSKDHPDNCGSGAPGNWGMQDFNGGSNSNAETKDWVLNGYSGKVLIDSNVPGDTGAFSNSISGELSTLINKEFGLPVFDNVTGNGSNAQFHIVGFVRVKLIGFLTTGSQHNRYLDLQFKVGTLAGAGCCTDWRNTGARAIDICGVDESPDPSRCGVG